MTKTFLYDTTLRDGTQGEGVNLTVDDKLNLAKKLDSFGMHYIEGGWPGSNPKDAEFFKRAKEIKFNQAKLAAFGSTRKAMSNCENDSQIKMLLDAQTPVVTMVAKTSTLHVKHVLETTLEENLKMISESVSYFKQKGKEVMHDAEHFFDGFKLDKEYAIATLKAARDAGANWLVLCDTNGGVMPWEVEEIIRETIQLLAKTKKEESNYNFGIHTHNDAGLAVANALSAIRSGCTQVQGTINGIGERVGNCDLITTIANLNLKLNDNCVNKDQLKNLTNLSRLIFETANLAPDTRQPYVGQSAFAHKGGIHVAAIMKLEESYQHIDPTLVGNEKRVLVSELSGRGNIAFKAKEFGLDVDSSAVKNVLNQIKELENQGFYFEDAEASMELMFKRIEKNYTGPFSLVDYMVVVDHRSGSDLDVLANLKLKVGDNIEHTAAEGDGPVNALDKALRKALSKFYPQINDIKLTDYKVRILDGGSATAATTRVTIETTCRDKVWKTVGASTNIIKASWLALADSIEYALNN